MVRARTRRMQGTRIEMRKGNNDGNCRTCAEHSVGSSSCEKNATPRISRRGKRLREATEHHAALPVPDRIVTKDEVSAARIAAASVKSDIEGIERDIQRAHGALEQVGGAVARERLRDATEAFELAERQERETEADYEAWRLLLDQMKEADAAQASNLGQALGAGYRRPIPGIDPATIRVGTARPRNLAQRVLWSRAL